MSTTSSSKSTDVSVIRWDLIDTVCLCHAGLAQDSPQEPKHYLLQVMNMLFGYLDTEARAEVETYLAEKKYLPPVDIQIAK